MRPHKLMVVDDSMVFRNRIARLAADPRLPRVQLVAMAENGEEAIAQARHHRPDLVTMDLTMPVMDGPACLEELRTVLPTARILVVSALSDRATALRAMAKGAHGFLLKPFSDDQMVQSLQELMA
jgi:two-component system chemotaxis response regulator CheY